MVRGLIRELFDITGYIIGAVAAIFLAPPLAKYLPEAINPFIGITVVGVVIFFVTVIIVKLIGWSVRKMVRHGPVKSLDRSVGGMIGLIKGMIVVIVLVILAMLNPFKPLSSYAIETSPILKVTTIVAEPIAQYCARGFMAQMSSKIVDIIPQDKLEKLSVAGISQSDIEKLIQVGSQKLTVRTMQDITSLIKKVEIEGLKLSDMSLDLLSPDSRKEIKSIMDDPSILDDPALKDLDLENLASQHNIDIEDLKKKFR